MPGGLLFDPDRFTNPVLADYGVPDDQPGSYYVSARGEEDLLLVGPFEEHADAMAWVGLARRAAHEADPGGAPWRSFGTARLLGGGAPPGLLNAHLGLPLGPLPRGTRPPVVYRVGRATFWQDPDEPLTRGWAWDGRRYCLPGHGPLPRGGIDVGEGLVLHTESGEIYPARCPT